MKRTGTVILSFILFSLLSTSSGQPESQQVKLMDSDAEAEDNFGRSVSIDGD